WINCHKEEAAKLLAPEFGLTPEKTLAYPNWEGMNYTSAPYGLMGFGEFMVRAGYIKRAPASLSEIAFDNVLAIAGSRAGGASEIEQLQY
ncbi:MAG TPA: ABC transporter substrate-binding protein, partial [Capillibacterium sp.]